MIGYLVLSLLVSFIEASPFNVKPEQDNRLDDASLATLQFVAVVSRHGSRTPLKTYPNDPYPYDNKLFWPTGPDELTYYGKKQLYETGRRLRRRYGQFLPELYYPNDTMVQYNNINRDFMSGACLLAGLYPPVGTAVWNHHLLWQPIPMKVRKFDVCALPYGTRCPAYKTEVERLLDNLDRTGHTNKKVLAFMQHLSQLTGKNISTYDDLFTLYDTLTMQVENGFALPAWARSLYPEPLKTTAAPLMLTEYGGSSKLIQLGAGPELKHINDILTMKANGRLESKSKFYVEAAHDCTLIALLRAFGYKDQSLVVRTSAYITFELHYLPPIYILQVFYYETSAVENPQIIDIQDCPSPCSLENFTKFVDTINPPNWTQACHLSKQL